MVPFTRSAAAWLRRLLWLGAAVLLAGLLEGACIVLDGLRPRPGHADVALVLGAGTELDGRPSVALRARLDRAVAGYRHGDFPWLVVSGMQERTGSDEATVMAAYLAAHGVPAERIIADHQGNHTYESARFTARLLRERGWRSVCVVTQYYHVPRARLALRRFGVGTVFSAQAESAEPDTHHVWHEMIGYVEYALRPYPDPVGQRR